MTNSQQNWLQKNKKYEVIQPGDSRFTEQGVLNVNGKLYSLANAMAQPLCDGSVLVGIRKQQNA